MKHKFIRVTDLKYLGNYEVELRFEDGASRKIDFESVLIGPFWGELKDKALFCQVYLDQEVGTIAWQNGADFDPDTLYHWDEVADQIRNQLLSA
jgi:hypothetical protein